jgi:hypothetical protein
LGFRHVILVVAFVGCTQNFDVFVAKDGGEDASQSSDATTDAHDAQAPCDAAASCLTSANLCGQSCVSSDNSCITGCGGSTACQSLCKSQAQTCAMTCVTICDDCVDAGCAESACQSALP